jgi:DNA-binding transcriptional LysR family regulator
MGMTVMTTKNSDDLRVRDLKVLSLILRERNLTRAAELLDTTQPSISKVLAKLREHFADPLLVRDGHVLRPTPRASEMAEPIRSLLATCDNLSTSAPSFDPRESERVFRLLVSDVGMILFLPSLMNRVSREGHKLGLHAVPLDSRHFESKLASGEADLALGAFPRAPRGLRRQRLYLSSYRSVVRRDHPQIAALRTRSGFRAARHIMVMASDTGHGVHQIGQHALEAEIAPENVLLRLSSFVAAAVVASRTDGVATVPANLASIFADQLDLTAFRPPIRLPPIEIAQYWHERNQGDAGHRWLRSTSFDLFAKSAR